MKLWSNGPSNKKSAHGKTNKHSRRKNRHKRPCQLSYNSRRRDLENAKRKLKQHILRLPSDRAAHKSWAAHGFKDVTVEREIWLVDHFNDEQQLTK
jgi:hypothetical protein